MMLFIDGKSHTLVIVRPRLPVRGPVPTRSQSAGKELVFQSLTALGWLVLMRSSWGRPTADTCTGTSCTNGSQERSRRGLRSERYSAGAGRGLILRPNSRRLDLLLQLPARARAER